MQYSVTNPAVRRELSASRRYQLPLPCPAWLPFRLLLTKHRKRFSRDRFESRNHLLLCYLCSAYNWLFGLINSLRQLVLVLTPDDSRSQGSIRGCISGWLTAQRLHLHVWLHIYYSNIFLNSCQKFSISLRHPDRNSLLRPNQRLWSQYPCESLDGCQNRFRSRCNDFSSSSNGLFPLALGSYCRNVFNGSTYQSFSLASPLSLGSRKISVTSLKQLKGYRMTNYRFTPIPSLPGRTAYWYS